MAQRNEALATAFEQVARRIVTAAERLSDAAWDVVPAGEARTAGQIAHHMANVYRNVGGFIQLAVAGQPLPPLTIGTSTTATPNRRPRLPAWVAREPWSCCAKTVQTPLLCCEP